MRASLREWVSETIFCLITVNKRASVSECSREFPIIPHMHRERENSCELTAVYHHQIHTDTQRKPGVQFPVVGSKTLLQPATVWNLGKLDRWEGVYTHYYRRWLCETCGNWTGERECTPITTDGDCVKLVETGPERGSVHPLLQTVTVWNLWKLDRREGVYIHYYRRWLCETCGNWTGERECTSITTDGDCVKLVETGPERGSVHPLLQTVTVWNLWKLDRREGVYIHYYRQWLCETCGNWTGERECTSITTDGDCVKLGETEPERGSVHPLLQTVTVWNLWKLDRMEGWECTPRATRAMQKHAGVEWSIQQAAVGFINLPAHMTALCT